MNKTNKNNNKRTIYLSAIIGLALLLILSYIYFNRPFRKHVSNIPSTTSLGKPVSSTSNSGPKPNKTDNTPLSSGTNTTLLKPWGNFISNHFPGQNDTSNAETSTCNTTPGAICYISFVNGSQKRYLEKKVADANGAVIWNWDVKQAGFSAGSWEVSAIATLNGQELISKDSLQLKIK